MRTWDMWWRRFLTCPFKLSTFQLNATRFLISFEDTAWTSCTLSLSSNWMKISLSTKWEFLSQIHTAEHFGYSKILGIAKDSKLTWPMISEDIREFLSDCCCGLAKSTRRKRVAWKHPKAVLPQKNPTQATLIFWWKDLSVYPTHGG